jgi:hypothetical protein
MTQQPAKVFYSTADAFVFHDRRTSIGLIGYPSLLIVALQGAPPSFSFLSDPPSGS